MHSSEASAALTAEVLRGPVLTRRLILRPPVATDLVAISRLINDPAIARNTSLIRYPYPVISGRRWIAAAQAASGRAIHRPYVMTLRSNPRLIAGAAGIDPEKDGVPTIGYGSPSNIAAGDLPPKWPMHWSSLPFPRAK